MVSAGSGVMEHGWLTPGRCGTLRNAALASCALLAGSCGATSPSPPVVPIGTWGGDHVSLSVTAAGATAQFDCASGTIAAPLTLTSSGSFDLPGVYVQGHGGPSQVGEPPDAHPARWVGSTDGVAMTLSVRLTDSGRVIGPYTLVLGGPPHITVCV
jgi:hypothetical protein